MTIAASEHSVSFWSLTSRDRGQLLAALLVGLLLVVPLALKVPMFIDDFGRSLSGSYDWSKDGRPLAELIYQTLMLGSDRVVLTSPLGQLLCLPGMALSSLLLCRIVNHRAAWAGALAAIFLFGQPYALQTLSYSFDSPLMVFAVLLSLAAGACLVLGTRPRSRIAAVALVVCSLATYQPANAAFWIVVLMALLFPDLPRERPVWRVLGDLVACQLLALLIYKYGVFSQLELKDYAAYHSALPPLGDFPAVLVENGGRYLSTLFDDWRETEAGLVFFIAALVALLTACFGRQRALRPGAMRWQSAMLAGLRALAVLVIVAISHGLPLLLSRPIFEPRTFVGIGVVMASLALIATRKGWRGWWNRVVLLVLIAAAWACITITYAYANAQAAQQALNHQVLQSVTQTIQQRGLHTSDFDRVVISGKTPRAPVADNTFRTFPYLKRLVKPVKGNWWGHIGLKHQGFRKPFKMLQPEDIGTPQPIASTSLYSLAKEGKTLVVHFHDS
jgi:hypothetical protein